MTAYGYARANTPDQDLTVQIEALHKAGCELCAKRSGPPRRSKAIWGLPPYRGAELKKYASLLVARVDAGDTRYALDLQARDIQVNWLKLPLTKDYSEVVDWTLALIRNADAL